MGDLSPKEIAMAVANMASSAALARAVHRNHNPRISRMPSDVSQTVATHATYGMAALGRKEFTSAAYSMKPAKCFRSKVRSHKPKREATAERKAVPSARRAYNTAICSQWMVREFSRTDS